MPKKNVPYFEGFVNYLIDIRDEYAKLAKKKDADELDLPEADPANRKTPYGTILRKKPETYSQQMALYVEKLNVVINNVAVYKNRATKADLEKQIADADKFYKDSLEHINDELAEARNLEEEMRNRYLSAYEMNAPYVEELKKKNLDNKEEINRYIPIDEFKKAWDEASRKLCKLQNAKVETENAYESKANELLEKYKTNEQHLKENADSLVYADAAWNNIIDSIDILVKDDKIRNLTEKQLEKSPETGTMSNYDKWRLQSDLATLQTTLLALDENVAYNENYKNVDRINEKFEKFEQEVADEFDPEYGNVELEGNEGIYAELDTEEMIAAAEFKKQSGLDVISAQKDDIQEAAIKNDDYGILLRTIKEDTTVYDKLVKEKEAISKTIAENTQQLHEFETQRDRQQSELDNWKDPEPIAHKDKELNDAKEGIVNARKAITKHNNKIAQKQKEVEQQEQYINESIPKEIDAAQKNLDVEVTELNKKQSELAEFNKSIEEFDKEYNAEFPADEFKDANLDDWIQEYIKLSPENTEQEINDLFTKGLKDAQEIGLEIANDRYNVRKMQDKFNALNKFRKAAETEGIKTVEQFKDDYQKNLDIEKEKYLKERDEITADYDKQIDELNVVVQSMMSRKPDDAVFNDVKEPQVSPAIFDVDDPEEDEEEYAEYLQEKGLLEKNLPGWKQLLSQQEHELLDYAQLSDRIQFEAEEKYSLAVETADQVLGQARSEIEAKYSKIEADIKGAIKPKDLDKFNNALWTRDNRFGGFEDEREEFLSTQKQDAEENERRLEELLAEKDSDHEREIAEKQEEYYRLRENTQFDYILNELENSAIPGLYSKIGVAQSQIEHYKQYMVAPDKLDPEDTVAKQLNDDYQNKIDKLEKDIVSYRNDIQSQFDSRRKSVDQVLQQHIATELVIKSQLQYLKEQYAKERQDFVDNQRAIFKKNQEDQLKEFDEKHQKEVEEFYKENFPDYQYEIVKRRDRFEQYKKEEIEVEVSKYLDEKEKALQERSNVENLLRSNSLDNIAGFRKKIENEIEINGIEQYSSYRKSLKNDNDVIGSIEDLLLKQQMEREEFMKTNGLDGNEHRIIRENMSEYQEKRVSRIPAYVGQGKKQNEKEAERLKERLDQVKQEKKSELSSLANRYNAQILNLKIAGSVDKDREMTELLNKAQNDLAENLKRLSALDAEKISLPNEIKLTELNLKDAKAELEKVKQDRDNEILPLQTEKINNREIVEKYEQKYADPKYNNIVDSIKKYRSTVELGELLKSDLDSFKQKNYKDAEGNPLSLMEAYRAGEALYELLDEGSNEDIAAKEFTFKSDAERAKAKTEAFYKREREFLFEASDEAREQYEFYFRIEQHKEAFLGIMDFAPKELEEFYKFSADSSQRESIEDLFSEKDNSRPDHKVRIDPEKLLNQIKDHEDRNLKASVTNVKSLVATEYYSAEQAKEDAERKVFEDNQKKQIAAIENDIALIKYDNIKAKTEIEKYKNLNKPDLDSIKSLDERLNTLNSEIEALKKKDPLLKTKTNTRTALNKEKAALLKKIAPNNKKIASYEAKIKKNEELINQKEAKIAKITEVKFKPKTAKPKEVQEKEREDLGLKLITEFNDKTTLHAIDNVFKCEHELDPVSHRWAAEISFHERKIKKIQDELDRLKESQRTNDEKILKCQNEIAKNTAYTTKFDLYARGFGKEYDDTKKSLEEANAKLKLDEERQIRQTEEQLKLQNALKDKAEKHDDDPFAQKNNLLKKRRLITAAVSKIEKDLAANVKHMEELILVEQTALDEYKALDENGLELDRVTQLLETRLEDPENKLTELDIINSETDKLAESRVKNAKAQKDNEELIRQTEAEIREIGTKEYAAANERYNALSIIAKDNEKLQSYYLERRRLEEEAASFNKIEKAHVILKARHNQTVLRKTIADCEGALSQAKGYGKAVETEIKELKADLQKMSELKSETVQTMSKAIEGFKTGVEDISIRKVANEKAKFDKLKNELNELQTGKEKLQLDKDLEDAQKYEQQIISENEAIDRENERRMAVDGIGGQRYKKAENDLRNKKEEIVKTEGLIESDKEKGVRKDKEIADEKANMRLKMLAERKKLGDNMLKLDKFNKLNQQRRKLENFQHKHLEPMFGEYKPADQIVADSEVSIVNVNANLKKRMSDIANMSTKVSKWYAGNSKEFTKMITAVNACASLADNTDPTKTLAALVDAARKAKEYIEKRETDWVKSSSLLRKSRLALAKDIIKTSKLLGIQYQKLANDKAVNQQKFEKYNKNRENIINVESSINYEKGTYGGFCNTYVKPISVSNDKKFDIYRARDQKFSGYTKNIYTKEWDSIEKDLNEKYQKNLEEIKKDKNVKPNWGPDTYLSRNLKGMYNKTFKADKEVMVANQDDNGNIVYPMMEEIRNDNLEHVIKKEKVVDSFVSYEYELDKTDFNQINISGQKQAFDKALAEAPKEFKLEVIPKNKEELNKQKSNKLDLNEEFMGLSNVDHSEPELNDSNNVIKKDIIKEF